jgi:hypothetical protein
MRAEGRQQCRRLGQTVRERVDRSEKRLVSSHCILDGLGLYKYGVGILHA